MGRDLSPQCEGGRTSALPLLPFPGPEDDALFSGVSAPFDAQGQVVDLRRLLTWQSTLEALPPVGGWTVRGISQVHGATIHEADKADGTTLGTLPEADALVTDRPGVLLVTRHADCPPVLLYDARRRVLGLAHSGRKGTLANIAGALVERMQQRFGSEPGELLASVGPGIRGCCYEVGPEALDGALGPGSAEPYVERRSGRLYLDLQAMIGAQLRAAGVGAVWGETDGECTCCGSARLHSYRRDRTTHRFAAVAGILP